MEFTDEQRNFLEAEGFVILHACPGSGKTAVVAHKFINYIKSWDRVHQGVAVLSFSNVASDEIEKQAQIFSSGKLAINYPHYIGTLDSFINNFIFLQFGYSFLNPPRYPKIVTDTASIPIFEYKMGDCYKCEFATDVSYFRLRMNGDLYYKNSLVDCQTKNRRGNNPCLDYKKTMLNNGLFFQNETARLAYELMKSNPQIASALAERFPIIIVDEAQDTSEDQMAVLDLLQQAGLESIFLVGDPDQAIYEWRDASPKVFIEKMFSKNWITLPLTVNFRSSQLICNATKFFSKSLDDGDANLAKGDFSDYEQKPILLLYDENSSNVRDRVFEKYLDLCRDNNIDLNCEDIAIVTRTSTSIVISDLWKSKEIEFFAKASYEWTLGARKKAYELCERALFSLLFKKTEDIKISIETEIEEQMHYESWRLIVLDVLINLPTSQQPLKDWTKKLREVLSQYLVSKKMEIRENRQLKDIIKVKRHDKNVPDLQKLSICTFFERKIFSNYTLSSVHGIKGETYSALMLFLKATKGKTLTPSFLNTGRLDDELMRVAYVAMTRPRKLLVVAMPNVKKSKNQRFSEEIWEYINI